MEVILGLIPNPGHFGEAPYEALYSGEKGKSYFYMFNLIR